MIFKGSFQAKGFYDYVLTAGISEAWKEKNIPYLLYYLIIFFFTEMQQQ